MECVKYKVCEQDGNIVCEQGGTIWWHYSVRTWQYRVFEHGGNIVCEHGGNIQYRGVNGVAI